jgi:hypothetical protein
MDSVRFGRSLGIGARSAAKALAGAIDAATAPNPGTPPPTPRPAAAALTRPQATGPIASAAQSAARSAARATVQVRETRQGITRGSKRFGDSVWGPLAKLSGVLWLEITGSFFGIFALFAGSAVWAHRTDLHSTPANHDARLHLLVFLAMTLVFGYFCISSFARAYRK